MVHSCVFRFSMVAHIFLRRTVGFGDLQDSAVLHSAKPPPAFSSYSRAVGPQLRRVLFRTTGLARTHRGRRASSIRLGSRAALSIVFAWRLLLRGARPPEKVFPGSACGRGWCNLDLRICGAFGLLLDIRFCHERTLALHASDRRPRCPVVATGLNPSAARSCLYVFNVICPSAVGSAGISAISSVSSQLLVANPLIEVIPK